MAVFFLLNSILSVHMVYAQVTNLSGTISSSQYTRVTDIQTGTATLVVDNAGNFTTGDRVLLIQMQGAVINSGNTQTFGNIQSIGGAGSYELNYVCDVTGNEISLQQTLDNSYATTNIADAGIQLVRVPVYVDVDVNGTLTAPAWDGTTGGILVLEATGTITLNADIDMSERGFRGGTYRDMAVAAFCFFGQPQYTSYTYSQATGDGGHKGEGVSEYITNAEYGRGKQANGGGGGNEHDAGGGGGGNYGLGGIGSQRTVGSCNGAFPGQGGVPLSSFGYSNLNNRVFMGGGGGAGFSNNEGTADLDYSGGNGGGIIILIADEIVGNGRTISANGQTHNLPGGILANDGASGGGAGGAVLISANTLTGSLNVEANGGDGTDTNSVSPGGSGCAGPGGGGGGGAIWTNLLPGSFNGSVNPGGAGDDFNASCPSATSSPGNIGAIIRDLSLNESVTANATCTLPVELVDFDGKPHKAGVALSWTSALEINHDKYVVERRKNTEWIAIGAVAGAVNSTEPQHYEFWDYEPFPGKQYYRLRIVSLDGGVTFSDQIAVSVPVESRLSLLPIPNPVPQGTAVAGRIYLPQSAPWQMQIFDLSGKLLHQVTHTESVDAGYQRFELSGLALPEGIYILQVIQQGKREIARVIVR